MPSLLDFIFPKKCVSCRKLGEYFCGSCQAKIEFVDEPVCPICKRQTVGGRTHSRCKAKFLLDGLVVACRYKDPVRKAISKVKYKWAYDIEKVLVELLEKEINNYDIPKKIILVAVPLHSKRKNWRGFNQAEILAENLAKKFGYEKSNLLIRIRETRSQVGLSKTERIENVQGAFSLKRTTNISSKNLMLVDDVYTSGATMAECTKVLKKAGAASVWGMAVALG